MSFTFRPAGMSDDEDSDFEPQLHDYYGPSKNSKNSNYVEDSNVDVSYETDRWAKYVNCHNETTPKVSKVDTFRDAIANGDLDTFRKMLQDGMSCNQVLPSSYDSCGVNPIFLSCEFGQPEILQHLIKVGASLSPQKSDGFTPLMATCSSIHCANEEKLVRCVSILCDQGQVNPNQYQMQRITALMLACKGGKLKVVEELIKHCRGIDLDIKDSQNWTSLLYAVDNCHGDIARMLLEAGNFDQIVMSEMFSLKFFFNRCQPKHC